MINWTLKALTTSAMVLAGVSVAQADVTLRGASMFDEEHSFTKTLREFERRDGRHGTTRIPIGHHEPTRGQAIERSEKRVLAHGVVDHTHTRAIR